MIKIDIHNSLDSWNPITLGRALEASILVIETKAKSLAPTDTGNLKGSISHETNTPTADLIIGANYWPYVEFGTVPHTIRPVNAKALYWKGADHPVKLVRHPGTPPQPFVRPAVFASEPKIKQKFAEIYERS